MRLNSLKPTMVVWSNHEFPLTGCCIRLRSSTILETARNPWACRGPWSVAQSSKCVSRFWVMLMDTQRLMPVVMAWTAMAACTSGVLVWFGLNS